MVLVQAVQPNRSATQLRVPLPSHWTWPAVHVVLHAVHWLPMQLDPLGQKLPCQLLQPCASATHVCSEPNKPHRVAPGVQAWQLVHWPLLQLLPLLQGWFCHT